jgi:hypothetical protein
MLLDGTLVNRNISPRSKRRLQLFGGAKGPPGDKEIDVKVVYTIVAE